MKPKITPRNTEVDIPEGKFIVSKTDLTGKITYANRTFMQVSNYSELELLGKQHNIVRHPDMPRGVFRFLWNEIAKGNEFFGYVKNLTADGAFYWVFANVTPDYDASGKMQGYYSVRRRPPRAAIDAVTPLYREMLEIEARAGAKAGPDSSMEWLFGKLAEMGKSYEQLVLGLYH